MSDERWLPIEDYPDYEVSDHGRVRSLNREVTSRWGTPRRLPGRALKPVMVGNNRNGKYCAVSLYRDGQSRQFLIHLLVLMAFVGKRPPGLIGCHGDDVRTNNFLSNLYWGTYVENGNDAVVNGLNWKSNVTHCPQQHEYTEDNTYINPGTGHRQCRKCIKARNKGGANADRTECPQGHAYDEENTYIDKSGRRHCRQCTRDRSRDYQRRKRGAKV